ncbi:MAG TPA: hypothetical protein PLO37_04990 [Candidatus Hydrogenedentes bacterium]|nr:hypothetical protein [Candidatus Hydrogenedentota bacterium]HPG66181.1 hypothetical protein [Candidatus Hydrogenedentota bacterium]
MPEHWIWMALTAACVIWYSSVTIYVAIRGAMDIKSMLQRLAKGSEDVRQDS